MTTVVAGYVTGCCSGVELATRRHEVTSDVQTGLASSREAVKVELYLETQVGGAWRVTGWTVDKLNSTEVNEVSFDHSIIMCGAPECCIGCQRASCRFLGVL